MVFSASAMFRWWKVSSYSRCSACSSLWLIGGFSKRDMVCGVKYWYSIFADSTPLLPMCRDIMRKSVSPKIRLCENCFGVESPIGAAGCGSSSACWDRQGSCGALIGRDASPGFWHLAWSFLMSFKNHYKGQTFLTLKGSVEKSHIMHVGS